MDNSLELEKYFHYQKILIFGDNFVGKSAFVKRINTKELVSDYKKTDEITNSKFSLYADRNVYDLNIYEINLDNKYEVLYGSLIMNCTMILFFYDVSNESSYFKLREQMYKIIKLDKKNVKKFLIANKIDLNKKIKVTTDDFEFLKDNEFNFDLMEISIKSDENISDLKQMICRCLDNTFNSMRNSKSVKDTIIYESDKTIKINPLKVECVFKIILLGDGGSGKSSFLNRYFLDSYENNYIMTVGVNENNKLIKINGNEIKLQIWDTAGQERFRSLPRKYYRHADGIILMYDTTNRESFKNVTKWIKDVSDNITKKIVIFLVGNKVDLTDQRVVSFSEALELSTKTNTMLYEISCKLDINVTETVLKLCQIIYRDSLQFKTNKLSFTLGQSYYYGGKSCCMSK